MVLSEAGAILGAGFLGAGSGLFSSALASRQNKHAYEQARALQQQQFEYNKTFAQNSHQWEVADLRKAGLNPILSANNGASGSVGIPGMSYADEAGAFSSGVNSALQASTLKSSIELNKANSAKAVQEAKTQENMRSNIDADTALKNVQSRLTEISTQLEDKKLSWYDRVQLYREKQALADVYNKYKTADAATLGAAAQQKMASASVTSANAAKVQADVARTSSPFKLFADSAKRHISSFEKDHPVISNPKNRYTGKAWSYVKNTFGY